MYILFWGLLYCRAELNNVQMATDLLRKQPSPTAKEQEMSGHIKEVSYIAPMDGKKQQVYNQHFVLVIIVN